MPSFLRSHTRGFALPCERRCYMPCESTIVVNSRAADPGCTEDNDPITNAPLRTTTWSIIVHPLFVHTLTACVPLRQEVGGWRRLPGEVLQLIAANLEAGDCCNLAATCKELRVLARDEAVWKQLCLRKFSVPRRPDPPLSWLELYKFNYKIFMRVFGGQPSEAAGPQLSLRGPIMLQA